MFTILILIASLTLSSSNCQPGTLSQYALEPTLAVVHYRAQQRTAYTLPANWGDYDGLLAVSDCRQLGQVYRVTWREHSGYFLAFDCAGSEATRQWMRHSRIIGEVDYWTARDWKSIGRGMRGATICRVDRIPKPDRRIVPD